MTIDTETAMIENAEAGLWDLSLSLYVNEKELVSLIEWLRNRGFPEGDLLAESPNR